MSLLQEQLDYSKKMAISTAIGFFLVVFGSFLIPSSLPSIEGDDPIEKKVAEDIKFLKIVYYIVGVVFLVPFVFSVVLVVGLQKKNNRLIRIWVIFSYVVCVGSTAISFIRVIILIFAGYFGFAMLYLGVTLGSGGIWYFLAATMESIRRAQLSDGSGCV